MLKGMGNRVVGWHMTPFSSSYLLLLKLMTMTMTSRMVRMLMILKVSSLAKADSSLRSRNHLNEDRKVQASGILDHVFQAAMTGSRIQVEVAKIESMKMMTHLLTNSATISTNLGIRPTKAKIEIEDHRTGQNEMSLECSLVAQVPAQISFHPE